MRPSKLICAWLALCLAGGVGAGNPMPVVLIVDTTSDAGLATCNEAVPADCSLRGALNRLGGVTTQHNVHFNIPVSDAGCVSGVCTISPATPLPDINPNLAGIVFIDGETQPGTVPNTLTTNQGGTNAQLKIVVTGTACGGAGGCDVGLRFNRSGRVRGLVINGFRTFSGGTGIVPGFDSGGIVEGCFIGTDVTGNISVPNGRGIFFGGNPFGGGTTSNGRVGGIDPAQRNLISGNISGPGGAGGQGIQLDGISHFVLGNLIGTNAAGTAALPNDVGIVLGGGVNFFQTVGNASASGRNVISGNLTAGIDILGAGGSGIGTNGTRIIGNFIGTDVSGTMPLGNGGFGIHIRAAANGTPLVGGTASGDANVIAYNGTEGVATHNNRGFLSGNRIFANGRSGISSTGSPRHPNDPGDPDLNNNKGQNFPDLSASAINGTSVEIGYRVTSSTANSAYPLRVEFFKADGDEGRDFLGADSYLAGEAEQPKTISVPIPAGVTLAAGDVIVATATDADGNTSEFSFSTATLALQQPEGPPCSGPGNALLVRTTAVASSGPFAPNGVVTITDDRGGSCTATLSPSATPMTSEGACSLANSGTPGPITITATLDTFRAAFATSSGTNVTATTGFNVQCDQAPVAVADTNTATEAGAAVTGNVLTNDTSGNAPASVSAASQGAAPITLGVAFATTAGGSLTLGADGAYGYTPPPQGSVPPAGLVETFNYTIRDADGDTVSSTLAITVNNADLAPVASADVNTASEGGTAASGNVLTNDTAGDAPATVTAGAQDAVPITLGSAFATAAGGSLTLGTNGSYSYAPPTQGSVPPAGVVETFNYTITDADGDTSSSTLTITVSDNDVAPTATADANTAGEGGAPVGGNVLSNDTLGDTPTTVTSASQNGSAITTGAAFTTAAGGSLTLLASGGYTYTPPPLGTVPVAGVIETFAYTITDADGDAAASTLTITIGSSEIFSDGFEDPQPPAIAFAKVVPLDGAGSGLDTIALERYGDALDSDAWAAVILVNAANETVAAFELRRAGTVEIRAALVDDANAWHFGPWTAAAPDAVLVLQWLSVDGARVDRLAVDGARGRRSTLEAPR